MYRLRGYLFLLIGLACGLSAYAERVRVANYNVRNYLTMDRMVDGHWRRDYPKPELAKAALRAMIIEASADVLVLQEMGGEGHLLELRDDLKSEGLDYPYYYVLDGSDKVRHVCMLSKIEPTKIIPHSLIDFKYIGRKRLVKRGLLQIDFATDGVKWSVYSVHLKSRRSSNKEDPESTKFRTGEARVIRDLIVSQYPDKKGGRFIVAGDFNDDKRSGTVKRFLNIGKRHIGYLVHCEDSRDETWTYNYSYHDAYERVDFFVMSPAMRPYLVGDGGTIVDTLPDSLLASDHRLIYLELDF